MDTWRFGHKSEAILRKTLQVADIQPTGTLTNCEGCNLTKAKQKGVPKTTTKRASSPGERLFADMSGPFTKTPKGNRYIVQVCDDYSRFGISGFSKE